MSSRNKRFRDTHRKNTIKSLDDVLGYVEDYRTIILKNDLEFSKSPDYDGVYEIDMELFTKFEELERELKYCLMTMEHGVQNTPKNRPSESQQNQGVKSSDLDVQKGNVL